MSKKNFLSNEAIMTSAGIIALLLAAFVGKTVIDRVVSPPAPIATAKFGRSGGCGCGK